MELLNENKITQDEYNILFEKTECKEGFLEAFNKVIQILKGVDHLHLDYIAFPNVPKLSDFYSYIIGILGTRYSENLREIGFWKCNFYSEINIREVNIKHHLHFGNAIFHKKVNFNKSIFEKRIDFLETKFYCNVTFGGVKFKDEASFWDSKAYQLIAFYSITCSKIFSINKLFFNKIDIHNAQFTEANFLELSGYQDKKNTSLYKTNFANKESARLIKAHFEKQGNITEANKYFVIEQEKYLEELKDKANITEGNKPIKLIPLYLNKYISNFGTDWIRAVLVLLVFAVVSNFIYGLFNDKLVSIFPLTSLNWIENIKDYLNTLVKMVNPLNAFKAKDNIFEDYEFFGAIVRIGSAAIIYQIIIAFRQFTRRA